MNDQDARQAMQDLRELKPKVKQSEEDLRKLIPSLARVVLYQCDQLELLEFRVKAIATATKTTLPEYVQDSAKHGNRSKTQKLESEINGLAELLQLAEQIGRRI